MFYYRENSSVSSLEVELHLEYSYNVKKCIDYYFEKKLFINAGKQYIFIVLPHQTSKQKLEAL